MHEVMCVVDVKYHNHLLAVDVHVGDCGAHVVGICQKI